MTYKLPVRRILNDKDLEIFSHSRTKQEILEFIKDLSKAIEGQTNDAECEINDVSVTSNANVILFSNGAKKTLDNSSVDRYTE